MNAGLQVAAAEWRRAGGFTLIEILIALAILGSSLVVLLTSIFHSIEMFRVAQDTILAGFLAQEKFTELENAKSSVNIGDSRDGVFEKAPGYAWRYQVSKVGLLPFLETVPGLRRLEVVVTWDTRPVRSIRIVSYLRDRETRPAGG
ncbi:MAG: type II secretion system protein [Candidatus Riflebacteria bacterium]|nr:type II secretion system protein [Candidatus Riflebacteria bacterium]